MMRLLILFVVSVLSLAATTLTGTLNSPTGALATGTLVLTGPTSVNLTVACGGANSSGYNVPQVNATVTNGVLSISGIVGNDCFTPGGTQYSVVFADSATSIVYAGMWTITGTTMDVGTLVLGATGPVAMSPTGSQVIAQPNGSKLYINHLQVTGDIACPNNSCGGGASIHTVYYAPAAKNIGGVGATAFQCASNCPSPTAIGTGSAATATLSVSSNTSNQTSQDQFTAQSGYTNIQTTIEIIWRTTDTTVAHTATVTPTFVCVGSGDIANPTFASAGGAITLTPPGTTNRVVSTNTFTPACSAGNTAFWKLAYNTTSGGGGAITDLEIISVRFYATF